jgi:hypothetical protein
MYEIRIPDHVYQQAAQAALAHHLSLEDFIIEAVQLHAKAEPENHDHIFTPKVIAELDAAAEEARNGKSFSGKQVDDYLAENKAAWLANRPS